jgi:hypothetical protein
MELEVINRHAPHVDVHAPVTPHHGIITFITSLACQPRCWLTVDNAQNPLKFLVD